MSTLRKKYKKFIIVFCKLLFLGCFISCEKTITPTFQDYTGQKDIIFDTEGNKYKTIGIGTQIWMAENLRATRLKDYTAILKLNDSLEWATTSYPGYCWYNNDTQFKVPYGALYNWYAVNTGKLCPTGYHIPSEDEWKALVNRLGGIDVTGGKLKVIGTYYWNSPNSGATNSSNFNAVPGGDVFYGHFYCLGKWSHWWSITQIDNINVTSLDLLYSSSGVLIGPGGRTNSCGLSVRCIKD